jgi:hypothetical protein
MEKLLPLPLLTVMLTWAVPGSCSQTNLVFIISDDQHHTLEGLVSKFVETKKAGSTDVDIIVV